MKHFLLFAAFCIAAFSYAAAVPDAGARAVLAKYAEKGKNRTPRTGRSAFFARSQLKYGPERDNYLHRWTDRPLLQDSRLQQAADGTFINPAVWKILHNTVMDYGIDGFAFFPMTKNRPYLFKISGTPGAVMTILPEFIKNAPLEKNLPIVDMMVKCPQVYRYNGKFVITTYSGVADPAYWVKLKKDLTAKYGDIFLFVPMHQLPRHLISNSKKTITAAEVEELADVIRKWLRCVDGYYYNYPALNEYRYFDLPFTQDVMIPLLTGILAEPEFKDKLLAWGTKVGHENFYVKGSFTYNCGGTSMLRGSVGSAVAAKADIINLVEWDEENENTHFRPTLANGFSTRRVIRYFSGLAQGKLLPPVAGDDTSVPDVILSYRRVLSAGETLDIELLNVPCAGNKQKEILPVTLNLKDLSGKVIRSFTGKLDNQKLDELRFHVPVAEVLDHHLLIPELQVGKNTFAAGFTPIELRANYNGDNKWYKHPVRDLAKCTAQIKVTPMADGKVRVDGKLSSDVPLHQVSVLDCGAEIWMDNSDPRFRESADTAVVKILVNAKPRAQIVYDGKIRIRGAKKLQLGSCGHNSSKYLITHADGWDLTGNYPSNFNSRNMVFAIDRASAETAEIDMDIKFKSPKFNAPLFKGTVKVKDILEKRVFAVAGPGLSHLIFQHNSKPDVLPPPSGRKTVEFSIISNPELPQSVYYIEAIDKNFRTFRSAPVTIYKPSGKKAEFSAFDVFNKKAITVKCDAALLTPMDFIISPALGAAVKNTGGNQLTGLGGGLSSIVNNMRYFAEGGYGNIAKNYLNSLEDNHNAAPEVVKKADGKYVWKFNRRQNVAFPTNTVYPYSGFEFTIKCTPAKVNGTRTLLSSSHAGFRLVLKKGVPTAEFYRANVAVRPVVTAYGAAKLEADKPATIVVRFDQKNLQVITNGVPGKAVPCSGYQLYPQPLSVGMDANGAGFVGEISELKLRPL